MQMNFMKGDILAADRGLYRHYGIYSGDGKVIHFVGFYHGKRNLLHVRVRETSLEEFVCGSAVFVDNSSSGDRRSREEIVREAKKYLDKKFGRGYNLITNNCEHFAHWCESGHHVSNQVNDKVDAVVDALRKPYAGIKVVGRKAVGAPLTLYKFVKQKGTQYLTKSVKFGHATV